MIQVTPQMRVLLAVHPVDFRAGIDGLVRKCRQVLGEDAYSGTVFVFCNRGRTAVKILVYDGQGFWLCHKRLSQGRFSSWPTRPDLQALGLQAHELQVLLRGGDPRLAKGAPDWRPFSATRCSSF
jgi:transposase